MIKALTRFTLLLLVLCLALPLGASAAQVTDVLVVASTTSMSGEFMAGMWGNNTADVDIRILLHDYPTIVWSLDEEASVNKTAVSQLDIKKNAAGDSEYTFTLKDNLRFSDGSPVTARDYVFSLLLEASPLIRELGGSNIRREYLAGGLDYVEGKTPNFSGVRLLDDQRFSLTVSQDFSRYYYDLTLVHVTPYPAAVIAPGCEVKDDGEGAYVEGLTAELLRTTLLDPVSGYVSHPGVVSGAYKLLSYDAQARTAEFEANPFFAGNQDGTKPTIKRLMMRGIKNAEVPGALRDNEVQLVNKLSCANTIDAVKALPRGLVRNVPYPRYGLAFLSFSAEMAPMSSQTFRHAISRMVDREAVTKTFLRGYGQPVYAYYGMGQWMPQKLGRDLKRFDKHPYDLVKAAELLEQDGWTLNSEGKAYDPAAGGLRHKMEGDQLMPLVLRLGVTSDNTAAEITLKNLKESLEQLGGQLEVSYLSMWDLLRQYYRQDERAYDMLFLASNFDYVFDPYYTYHAGEGYQGVMNRSGLCDEHLQALARTLRETRPRDRETFLKNWIAFQDYWTDVMPLLPIYSSTYHDAFNAKLTNYHPERFHSWADAIIYAKFE